MQNGGNFALEQTTDYPYSPEITMRIHAERAETFAVYVRVPAWAGPKTTLAVNGSAASTDVKPGSFVALRRQWKDGDRIEYSIDMPLRLEAVDAQHSNVVALLNGPLTLFAVDAPNAAFTRQQLLGAAQRGSKWTVESGASEASFLTFSEIHDQEYRLYHDVGA
jgi:DUF1680 family protein